MGVDIKQPFLSSISGSLGSIGPVTVAGSLGAIGPVSLAGLPDIHIFVEKLPKIQLGIDPVTLTLNPVDVNLRLKEFPSIRGHLPADFCVGLSFLGIELLSVRLCGEAQIITEPYVPNPCETCITVTPTPNPVPVPVPGVNPVVAQTG